MPAKAGIQVPPALVKSAKDWIPAGACPELGRRAGMTEKKVDFQSTLLEPLGFEPRVVQCGGSIDAGLLSNDGAKLNRARALT